MGWGSRAALRGLYAWGGEAFPCTRVGSLCCLLWVRVKSLGDSLWFWGAGRGAWGPPFPVATRLRVVWGQCQNRGGCLWEGQG